VIFFIVFIGFAQAHCMVFHSRLYTMRTFGMTWCMPVSLPACLLV
jgi:hypothetical protein